MNFLSKRPIRLVFLIALLVSSFVFTSSIAVWGFYGHRKINRMAVYCLPSDMINLFKKNIDYISEHAVDPDKRRYATKFEAVRHYIDIDHWGERPFENVPRIYHEAVTKYGIFQEIRGRDTILLDFDNSPDSKEFHNRSTFIRNNWLRQRYQDEIVFECDSVVKYFDILPENCQNFRFTDDFSTYGIIPYELENQQRRLTQAFKEKDIDKIIRLATDMGHYIGDAHVPLHTTENYNGQMTNQDGIHAFWESRLPELYADSEYDFLVGQADYIKDKKAFFWKIVKESHRNLEKVLAVEKQLQDEYSKDRQFCYEERLGATVRIQCEEYSREYHNQLGGMVEDRMRASIKAVADCWYTAWVDAGQPYFGKVGVLARIDERIEEAFKLGEIFGRKH